MAIATVITRGYGNGTYTGTIGLLVTRGYTFGAAVATVTKGGLSMTLQQMRRRERQQLLAMLRKDDDELLPLIIGSLKRR